nr:putative retrotransposon Ty1-copia subclass protein [Tanacetum cinerariifolium]
TRRAPYRMCLNIDAKEHELGDLGELANYKDALLDPESKKWLDAMNVEMQFMKDNDTGYVFVLNRGAVDWKGTKQSIFATSSINVEYIFAFDESKEAVWIHKLISRLGIVPTIKEPISMYCDNSGAIAIAKDDGVTKGGLWGSKKLKPGDFSLYVDDGHRAAIEAIGTYHLELPSGLVIVLNNGHCAPSITSGVILVSRLFDDGFINRFDENNVILATKNNLVYFDIFEIDMSCSNTNDSSMYVFQKELDNQLEKTIMSLRSDRGEDDQDLMCLYMFLYIDTEEHELGDLGEPCNYKAALLDPESKKWLDPMNVEMQSMKDNDVWVLVELPPIATTVGSKWYLKKKTDIDGVVYIFKVRLVAKGFTQTYMVDYKETFSSIVDIRAIRILIAIAAYYDYKI